MQNGAKSLEVCTDISNVYKIAGIGPTLQHNNLKPYIRSTNLERQTSKMNGQTDVAKNGIVSHQRN